MDPGGCHCCSWCKSRYQVDAIKPELIVRYSRIRAAIPILPMPMAMVCFLLNLILPGSGTVLSGVVCLCCCCGRTRFDEDCNADWRCEAFLLNLMVGISQMATVILCGVGWCWSIGWGITLISVSKRNQVAATSPQTDSKNDTKRHESPLV